MAKKGLMADKPPRDLGPFLPDHSEAHLQGYGSTVAQKRQGYARVEGPPMFPMTHRDYPDEEGFITRPGLPMSRQ